jgi:hypothetical protein
MDKPVYEKWNPTADIPARLVFEEVRHADGHFSVLLRRESKENSVLRVFFDSVLFYRTINESYLLRTLQMVENLGGASLYIVDNSPLLSWFHEESLNIYNDWRIKHYAILTPDECIDILASIEPVVEWLKDNRE